MDVMVGNFQRKISAATGAYQSFMKKSGPDGGARCETYTRARDFSRSHLEMAALAARHAPQAKKD